MTIILDNGKHFNLIKWEHNPIANTIHVYFEPLIGCNDTVRIRGYLLFSPYMYSDYNSSTYNQLRDKFFSVYRDHTDTTWKLRWTELSLTKKETLIASLLNMRSGLCAPGYSGFYSCATECSKYLIDVQLIDNKETTKMTDNTALLDKLLQPTGEEEATDYCDEHVYMFDCDPDSDEYEDEYENEEYELDSNYMDKMEQIYNMVYDCDVWLRRESRRYSEGDISSIEQQLDDMYDVISRLHTYASDYVE